MTRFVWLETGGTVARPPALMVCKSIAQAVRLGVDGDQIFAHDPEAHKPAAFPTHRIVASASGRKRAVRLHYPR